MKYNKQVLLLIFLFYLIGYDLSFLVLSNDFLLAILDCRYLTLHRDVNFFSTISIKGYLFFSICISFLIAIFDNSLHIQLSLVVFYHMLLVITFRPLFLIVIFE